MIFEVLALSRSAIAALAEAPITFWIPLAASVIALGGVIASSAVALVGVIYANRGNSTRLSVQLAHDSKQRSEDRLHALRKDVYLKAAEEVVAATNYLAAIPKLDPSKVNLADGTQGLLALSAQLQLVTSDTTVDLVGEYTSRYGEAFTELLLLAKPVHEANTDIRIHGELHDSNSAQAQRVLDEMRVLNESGKQNPERFAALQRSLDFFREQIAFHSEERAGAFERSNLANSAYQLEMLARMERIADAQLLVSVALRKEIGLDSDIDRHRDVMRRGKERMTAALHRLMLGLQSGEGEDEVESDLRTHAESLGGLLGDIQSLEFSIRLCLSRREGSPVRDRYVEDFSDAPVGSIVPESDLSSYASLGRLIREFNVIYESSGIAIDPNLVEIRDVLAHGRVFSGPDDFNFRVVKFDKPVGGEARLSYNQVMDEAWFKEQKARLVAAISDVMSILE